MTLIIVDRINEAMAAKGYGKSPGGKTPHSTLYSAILREIGAKGEGGQVQEDGTWEILSGLARS